MSVPIFTTAQDAENAFYDSLERCDLELMMAVWAEDEDIVCVHPAGARIAGQEPVRESWRRIFASGQRLRVKIAQPVTVSAMMVEVRSVHEVITVVGEEAARPPMVATNVYVRTAAGWRMVAHHASPAPEQAADEETTPEPPPKLLH
jgi:ketosteroid isomerase-like protein